MTAPALYAHAIKGGWELRHAGCAPTCCEAVAVPARATDDAGAAIPHPSGGPSRCAGCGGACAEPPRPMDLDRNAPCEQHAPARPHVDARPASALSARDILAAHAHAGLLASGWSNHIAFNDGPDEQRLRHAYALADLQLAEKDRQEATRNAQSI